MTNTTQSPVIGRMDYVPSDSNYRFEVTFDLADITYTVQERHQSDNATSIYNYLGHSVSYVLPQNTDATAFAAWVNEDAWASLIRIKNGYTSEWNGQNNVAVFDDDAKAARELLDGLFGAYVGQDGEVDSSVPILDDGAGQWDASDWLNDCGWELLERHHITENSTSYDLEVAAVDIDAEALRVDVRLSGTRQWLGDKRDTMIAFARDIAIADAENDDTE